MLPEVPDNLWGGWLSASSDTANRIALSLLPSCSAPPIPRMTAEFLSGSSSFLRFSVSTHILSSNKQQKKKEGTTAISYIPSLLILYLSSY